MSGRGVVWCCALTLIGLLCPHTNTGPFVIGRLAYKLKVEDADVSDELISDGLWNGKLGKNKNGNFGDENFVYECPFWKSSETPCAYKNCNENFGGSDCMEYVKQYCNKNNYTDPGCVFMKDFLAGRGGDTANPSPSPVDPYANCFRNADDTGWICPPEDPGNFVPPVVESHDSIPAAEHFDLPVSTSASPSVSPSPCVCHTLCQHGTCSQSTCVCECELGWKGPWCNRSDCEHLDFCNAHGNCLNNKCVCLPTWTSEDCSVPTCFDHKVCSKHGACVMHNISEAEPRKGHPASSLEGVCQCFPPFFGADCAWSACPDNCNFPSNGVCDFDLGKCDCFGEWGGPSCGQLDLTKVARTLGSVVVSSQSTLYSRYGAGYARWGLAEAGKDFPASLVVFGGLDVNMVPRNDIYLYNLEKRQFTMKIPVQPGPTARFAHSGIAINGNWFIYGGTNGTRFYDDLWIFYFDQQRWEVVDNAMLVGLPGPRAFHQVVAVAGVMYLFGGLGRTANTLGDMWRFDATSLIWNNLVSPSPAVPAKRWGHAMFLDSTFVYVFGGLNSIREPLSDCWRMSLVDHTWKQLSPAPLPMYGHAVLTLDVGQYLMFGGSQVFTPEMSPMNVTPPAHAMDRYLFVEGVMGQDFMLNLTTYYVPPSTHAHTSAASILLEASADTPNNHANDEHQQGEKQQLACEYGACFAQTESSTSLRGTPAQAFSSTNTKAFIFHPRDVEFGDDTWKSLSGCNFIMGYPFRSTTGLQKGFEPALFQGNKLCIVSIPASNSLATAATARARAGMHLAGKSADNDKIEKRLEPSLSPADTSSVPTARVRVVQASPLTAPQYGRDYSCTWVNITWDWELLDTDAVEIVVNDEPFQIVNSTETVVTISNLTPDANNTIALSRLIKTGNGRVLHRPVRDLLIYKTCASPAQPSPPVVSNFTVEDSGTITADMTWVPDTSHMPTYSWVVQLQNFSRSDAIVPTMPIGLQLTDNDSDKRNDKGNKGDSFENIANINPNRRPPPISTPIPEIDRFVVQAATAKITATTTTTTTSTSTITTTTTSTAPQMVFVSLAEVPTAHAVLKGLAAATSYSFRIVALNTAGDSTPSLPLVFQTPPRPAVPANFAIVGVTESSVMLTWDEPQAPSFAWPNDEVPDWFSSLSFELSYCDVVQQGAPCGNTTHVTLTQGTHRHQLNNLLSNQIYRFEISSRNRVGPSIGSSVVHGQTRWTLPSVVFYSGVGCAGEVLESRVVGFNVTVSLSPTQPSHSVLVPPNTAVHMVEDLALVHVTIVNRGPGVLCGGVDRPSQYAVVTHYGDTSVTLYSDHGCEGNALTLPVHRVRITAPGSGVAYSHRVTASGDVMPTSTANMCDATTVRSVLVPLGPSLVITSITGHVVSRLSAADSRRTCVNLLETDLRSLEGVVGFVQPGPLSVSVFDYSACRGTINAVHEGEVYMYGAQSALVPPLTSLLGVSSSGDVVTCVTNFSPTAPSCEKLPLEASVLVPLFSASQPHTGVLFASAACLGKYALLDLRGDVDTCSLQIGVNANNGKVLLDTAPAVARSILLPPRTTVVMVSRDSCHTPWKFGSVPPLGVLENLQDYPLCRNIPDVGSFPYIRVAGLNELPVRQVSVVGVEDRAVTMGFPAVRSSLPWALLGADAKGYSGLAVRFPQFSKHRLHAWTSVAHDNEGISVQASQKGELDGDVVVVGVGVHIAVKRWDCYSGRGTDYRGPASMTHSGRVCVAWNEVEPLPSHQGYIAHDLTANLCRNPDADPSGPWCYAVQDNGVARKEHCNVCGDCYFGNGRSYRGNVATTIDGFQCLDWADPRHHDQHTTPAALPAQGLDLNKCRNPDGSRSGLWCKTAENRTGVAWGMCGVCDEVMAVDLIQIESFDNPNETGILFSNKLLGSFDCVGCDESDTDQPSNLGSAVKWWLEKDQSATVLVRPGRSAPQGLAKTLLRSATSGRSARLDVLYSRKHLVGGQGGHELLQLFEAPDCSGHIVEVGAFQTTNLCLASGLVTNGLDANDSGEASLRYRVRSVLLPPRFGVRFFADCIANSSQVLESIGPDTLLRSRCLNLPAATGSIMPLVPSRVAPSLNVSVPPGNAFSCQTATVPFALGSPVPMFDRLNRPHTGQLTRIPPLGWWRDHVFITCVIDSTIGNQVLNVSVGASGVVYLASPVLIHAPASCPYLIQDFAPSNAMVEAETQMTDTNTRQWNVFQRSVTATTASRSRSTTTLLEAASQEQPSNTPTLTLATTTNVQIVFEQHGPCNTSAPWRESFFVIVVPS